MDGTGARPTSTSAEASILSMVMWREAWWLSLLKGLQRRAGERRAIKGRIKRLGICMSALFVILEDTAAEASRR